MEVAVLAASRASSSARSDPSQCFERILRVARPARGRIPQMAMFSFASNLQGCPRSPAEAAALSGAFRDRDLRHHGARHRSDRIRGRAARCAASRRGPARARARARPVPSSTARPGVEVVARRPPRPAPGSSEALDGCSTAYYLVHSMEPAAGANDDFARRDRRAGRELRERRGTRPGSSGSSTSAGSFPPTPAPSRAPAARGSRSSASCSTAVPRLHRAAGVDRDRRGLVLVPHPRAARGAAARAAASPLAREPHAADRRARRDRVPRPHARDARTPRAARSTSPGPT